MSVIAENPEMAAPSQSSARRLNHTLYAIYALAIAASISVWFIAIHAPLRQDETGTWWEICAGLSNIWSRHQHAFPSYLYILWFSTKIFGTSEIALRVPSLLAMLGAVYLLYLAACDIFSRELAIIAVVIFCLHPFVIFESIDVRTYAFAVLATNATIYVLLRLRRSESNWLAVLFGSLAALIVSFHYLFATILPALLICFFVFKAGNRKILYRQLGIAIAVFALALLPMIPGLLHLFRIKGNLVFTPPPSFVNLVWTLAPGLLSFVFCGAALMAALLAAFRPNRPGRSHPLESRQAVFCVSLALIPLMILFGLSVTTPVHYFFPRYCLVSVPGIALCWALLVDRFFRLPIRLLFCAVLVTATCFQLFRSPESRQHGHTWKYAYAAAEKNALSDNAPVLICSGFIESHLAPMPLHSAKTSWYFASLSYYKLSVPVVPLPLGLSNQAMEIGSQFLTRAAQQHQRFLAVAGRPSYETLEWLSQRASENYKVREIGIYDDIKILEFDPRIPPTPPLARSSDQPPPPSVKAASKPATP